MPARFYRLLPAMAMIAIIIEALGAGKKWG